MLDESTPAMVAHGVVVAVGVMVGASVDVGVTVSVLVAVAVDFAVGVDVLVDISVGVALSIAVAVGVTVGDGVLAVTVVGATSLGPPEFIMGRYISLWANAGMTTRAAKRIQPTTVRTRVIRSSFYQRD